MLLESFAQTILKWLRVPPGASVRHQNEANTSSAHTENDYISAIIDITTDDICVGDNPLTIQSEKSNKRITKILDDICVECNTVVKDVTKDLLREGLSIYEVEYDKNDNSIILLPYLELVDIYLTNKKELIIYKQGEKDQLKEVLVFINYSKASLQVIEDRQLKAKGIRYQVTPEPMQLKNADKTINALNNAEDSVSRYRNLLRPVRLANVDIGISQGDHVNDTVNGIASAINANSASLGNQTAFNEFDDNIPVLPNRNGKGKVDIYSDIPTADIKSLVDLEYYLSKLNLIMRFPATYMDFSRALSETALSLVRGDLRYIKLVKNVQSKILRTLNKFIQESKLSKYKPVFYLTSMPSSEDDDVNEALENYVDIAEKVAEFIKGDDISKQDALLRLEILRAIFASSTTSPLIQTWLDSFETYIKTSKSFTSDEPEDLGPDDDFDFDSDEDFESGGPDNFEPIETSESEIESAEESFEPAEDVEFIEPQT